MKKILIIEDKKTDFKLLKDAIEGLKYSVLPIDFDEMKKTMDSNLKGERYVDYAIRQIDDHYEDIRLIICDIKLGSNLNGGIEVVRKIRNYQDLNQYGWTALVPIIAVTRHDDLRLGIVEAGADFVIDKPEKKSDPQMRLLKTIIGNQIIRFEDRLNSIYPLEIRNKINQFKLDNQGRKTAFIMTSFQKEHKKIAEQILSILDDNKINGYLADQSKRQNDKELWHDVEVYAHGCDFGIGIYADDSIFRSQKKKKKDDANEKTANKKEKELIKRIRINPNLSQEVGYMLGLQKKVCILKDKKLDKINTDLSSWIYQEYTKDTLEKQLVQWLKNNKFI